MKVTLYTDPGCPFGFNAQRQELQLMWHYGHASDIATRDPLPEARALAYKLSKSDGGLGELEQAGASFTPSAGDGYWAAA